MRSNQTMVDDLEPIAEAGRLTTWETDFLDDMRVKLGTPLSDAQEEKLNEIHVEHCR